MIFGEGERRRTICTSSENSTKSTKIAAFWQGSFYSCLAWRRGVFFITNASENIIFTGDLKNTKVLKNKPPRGKIYIV